MDTKDSGNKVNDLKALLMTLALLRMLGTGVAAASSPESVMGTARWIQLSGDPRPESPLLERSHKTASKRKTFPAPLMRRGFAITGEVKHATASVCGLGYFELYLNGTKVGDHVLDPVQTSYEERACYVTLDITEHLQPGDNAVGLMLGNGFFGQNFALSVALHYGNPTAIASLAIEYVDGSEATIVTDANWKAATGPVLFDNVYAGETYDARLEVPGWSKAGFDDAGWSPVTVVDAPTRALIAQSQPPMRKSTSIAPTHVMPTDDDGWILDMGRNMTGWLQIRVAEPRGTQIKMSFAEHLMPDGKSIDTASTGVHVTGDDQTEIYVCKGGGMEEWEPRFTYHGFRYVQISGLSRKPELKDYTGWLVRTAVERIGSFECSDALLNKFYDVSMWTIECNLQGVLSDCPHREKCAWMGDMHAVGEAASLNYDMEVFWRKVSQDMNTVTGKAHPMPGSVFPRDKRVPSNIAVGKRLCQQARPDWGVATVLVPWYSYLYYGDRRIVEETWPLMAGWIDYIEEFGLETGVIEEGYGDWCPPGGNPQIDTPVGLSSTALFYQALQAMARMAHMLEKPQQADAYRATASSIRKAFNARFYDASSGDYGSQTGTTMALHLGLVPNNQQAAVAEALVQRIMEVNKGHYSTGIHGHRSLYTVLNDAGHGATTDLMLHQTSWPSLSFLTETHDLTTWPEVPFDWPEGERYRRNSFSHPMHSGFAAMFHESLGGIRPDPEHPGFKRVLLKPCFLPGLEWAKATHRSPQGMISSHWTRTGEQVTWKIVLPAATPGEIWLPAPAEVKSENVEYSRSDRRWRIYNLTAGTSRLVITGL